MPLDLDRLCEEARERVHRSIGQRARWAKWSLARAVREAKEEFIAPEVKADHSYYDGLQWVDHSRHIARLQEQAYQQTQLPLLDVLFGQGATQQITGMVIDNYGRRVLP